MYHIISSDSSQDAPYRPPPPVSWSHVTGLQPIVIGLLKSCVRELDDLSLRPNALRLLPTYLIYTGAYYSQLKVQVSV